MNGNVLIAFLGGVAIGAYFAEPIREKVPQLDGSSDKPPVEGETPAEV